MENKFFDVAPGAIWTAVIVLLMLIADWLSTYFGDVPWVPPVAGLLATVIVPTLKVIFQSQEQPAGFKAVENQSKVKRWLL